MPTAPEPFRMPGYQTSDQKRPNAHQRGYTRQWNNMAKRFRMANPFCAQCASEGRDAIPAEHVDHIKPFRGDLRLRDDPSNWQSLCAECHGKKTRAEQLGTHEERPS